MLFFLESGRATQLWLGSQALSASAGKDRLIVQWEARYPLFTSWRVSTLKHHTTVLLKLYSSHVVIAANISKPSLQTRACTAKNQTPFPARGPRGHLFSGQHNEAHLLLCSLTPRTAQLTQLVASPTCSPGYTATTACSKTPRPSPLATHSLARLTAFPSSSSCPLHGPKPSPW